MGEERSVIETDDGFIKSNIGGGTAMISGHRDHKKGYTRPKGGISKGFWKPIVRKISKV